MRRFVFIFAILSLLSTSLQALAQTESEVEKEKKEAAPFSFFFTVRDAAGDFVSNLIKEDFKLLVNDQAAEILSLAEFRPLFPGDAEVTGYLASLKERKRDGLQPLDPPFPPKNYFLVFDQHGLSNVGLEKALEISKAVYENIVLPWDRVFIYQLEAAPIRLAGPVSGDEEIEKTLGRISALDVNLSDHEPIAGFDELLLRTAVVEGRTAIILFTERSLSSDIGDVEYTEGYVDESARQQTFLQKNQLYSEISSYQLLRGLSHSLYLVDCGSEPGEPSQSALADVSVGGGVYSAEKSALFLDKISDSFGSYYRIECRPADQTGVEELDVRLEFSVQLPFVIRLPGKHFLGLFDRPEQVTEDNSPQIHADNYLIQAGKDLPVALRLLQMPYAHRWGALALIEIDSEELPHSNDDPFELERIISIIDSHEHLIFHSHKHYLANRDESLPEKIWLLETLPLADANCQVRILVRDVNGGLLFIRSLEVGRSLDSSVRVGEPFLLREAPDGIADDWRSAAIDDGIDAEIERYFSVPLPPGIPSSNETVKQGEFATIYLMLDWADEAITSGSLDISTDFILSGKSGEYRILARNQRILPLPNRNSIAILTEVPLGLAQDPKCTLRVEIKGPVPGSEERVFLPFIVHEFDPDTALELLKSDDIHMLDINEETEELPSGKE